MMQDFTYKFLIKMLALVMSKYINHSVKKLEIFLIIRGRRMLAWAKIRSILRSILSLPCMWLVYFSSFSKEYVIFTLKYPLPEGLVHEEYILYDEVAIVGSIGGTLGLFIGFSFRDIVVYILDKLRHHCINNPWH